MFALIHQKSDYVIYGGISIFAASASNICNLVNVHRYIQIRPVRKYQFQRHLKPVMIFFAMSCATTIYTNLDTVMLGFIKTDIDVGYYNAAVKIKSVLLGIVTSLGTVLLPRASYYIEHHEMEEFRRITKKAINFVFLIAVPLTCYFILYAKEGILFLSGKEYMPAVIPMQIIMPVVVLTGAAQVCIMQALIPLKKDKAVLLASVIGAVTAVLFNIMFVGQLGAIGSALVLLCSEICSDIFAFGYAIKKKVFTLPWRFIVKRIISSIPYIAICYTTGKCLNLNNIATLFIALLICGFYFGVEGLFVLKLPIVRDFFAEIKKQIR